MGARRAREMAREVVQRATGAIFARFGDCEESLLLTDAANTIINTLHHEFETENIPLPAFVRYAAGGM